MSQVVENLLNKSLAIQPLHSNELAKSYAIRICQKVTKPDDYTHIIASLIDEIDNLSAMTKTISLALADAKQIVRKTHAQEQAA